MAPGGTCPHAGQVDAEVPKGFHSGVPHQRCCVPLFAVVWLAVWLFANIVSLNIPFQMLPSNINYHISRMPLSPFFIKGAGVQNIPFTGVMGPALHLPAQPGPREQLSPAHGGGHQHLPDLFLYSMSKPVMMLFPSNRCVHRKFMLRAFTSRISSSGGSGGSWGDTGRSGGKVQGERERKAPGTAGPREALPHPTPRVRVPIPSAACGPPGFGDGQRTGARTLDGELDQASVFTI